MGGITRAAGYPAPEKSFMFGEVELEIRLALCTRVPLYGGNASQGQQTKSRSSSFAGIILPIVITLIVITLSAFSLVALYRMCQKKTPGIWFAFSEVGKRSMCGLLLKDLWGLFRLP